MSLTKQSMLGLNFFLQFLGSCCTFQYVDRNWSKKKKQTLFVKHGNLITTTQKAFETNVITIPWRQVVISLQPKHHKDSGVLLHLVWGAGWHFTKLAPQKNPIWTKDTAGEEGQEESAVQEVRRRRENPPSEAQVRSHKTWRTKM